MYSLGNYELYLKAVGESVRESLKEQKREGIKMNYAEKNREEAVKVSMEKFREAGRKFEKNRQFLKNGKNMLNKTYKFHSDAGHGWLAVKVNDLVKLGIHNQVTHYSYINGQTVYLEEDGDAGLFIQAFKNRLNALPKIKNLEQVDDYSRIRSYRTYSPNFLKDHFIFATIKA